MDVLRRKKLLSAILGAAFIFGPVVYFSIKVIQVLYPNEAEKSAQARNTIVIDPVLKQEEEHLDKSGIKINNDLDRKLLRLQVASKLKYLKQKYSEKEFQIKLSEKKSELEAKIRTERGSVKLPHVEKKIAKLSPKSEIKKTITLEKIAEKTKKTVPLAKTKPNPKPSIAAEYEMFSEPKRVKNKLLETDTVAHKGSRLEDMTDDFYKQADELLKDMENDELLREAFDSVN